MEKLLLSNIAVLYLKRKASSQSKCLKSFLNLSWHRFNKMLNTFLWILVHTDILASVAADLFAAAVHL